MNTCSGLEDLQTAGSTKGIKNASQNDITHNRGKLILRSFIPNVGKPEPTKPLRTSWSVPTTPVHHHIARSSRSAPSTPLNTPTTTPVPDKSRSSWAVQQATELLVRAAAGDADARRVLKYVVAQKFKAAPANVISRTDAKAIIKRARTKSPASSLSKLLSTKAIYGVRTNCSISKHKPRTMEQPVWKKQDKRTMNELSFAFSRLGD